MEKKQFLEIHDTEEANTVDQETYRLEKYSESRDAWLFVKRKGK